MNIRKSIKYAMVRADINQIQYAELAGVSRAYLNLCVSGKANPSTKTLEKLAKVAGLSVSEFIALGEE